MRPLALLALLMSACSPRPATPTDSASLVRGTVERVDLSPMAYDGDAELTIQTEAGESVEVRVPARMNLCEASGLGTVGTLAVGDSVEVRGAMDGGIIRPCTSEDHVVRRPGFTSGTFEGAYALGFETSGLRPCEQPDANWWVRGTDDLRIQYDALAEAPGGRGLGPFARIVVEGELSPEGSYGHLGGWDRLLIVTRVVSVEEIGPSDGEWPTLACSR